MIKKIKPIIGWREEINLVGLGVKNIKAKVDSGAKTSALHVTNLEFYKRKGEEYVKFDVHPLQRKSKPVVKAHSKVYEYRNIKSSNGQSSERPVIITEIEMMGIKFPIELTLVNRELMGFRMLLGRQALRKRFLIDAEKSFLGTKNNLSIVKTSKN